MIFFRVLNNLIKDNNHNFSFLFQLQDNQGSQTGDKDYIEEKVLATIVLIQLKIRQNMIILDTFYYLSFCGLSFISTDTIIRNMDVAIVKASPYSIFISF